MDKDLLKAANKKAKQINREKCFSKKRLRYALVFIMLTLIAVIAYFIGDIIL